MAEKKKKNYDPEDDITHDMFKRAKELGYDVDNPTAENVKKVKGSDLFRSESKRMIEEEKKRKKK